MQRMRTTKTRGRQRRERRRQMGSLRTTKAMKKQRMTIPFEEVGAGAAAAAVPPLANGLAKPPADGCEDKEDEPREAQLAVALVLLNGEEEEVEPKDRVAGAEKREGVDEGAAVGGEPNEKLGAAALVEKLKVGAENDHALVG